MNRLDQIRSKLTDAFAPTLLELEDESHLHIGHAGARSGGGHFAVKISADGLQGLSRVMQHRKIYQALGDMMGTDIHALRIDVC